MPSQQIAIGANKNPELEDTQFNNINLKKCSMNEPIVTTLISLSKSLSRE
jgi:hypothetical protein